MKIVNRPLKSTFIFLFISVLLFVGWILANSKDIEKQDLGRFDLPFKTLPAEVNGYHLLNFDNLDSLAGDRSSRMVAHAKGLLWQQEFVDELLQHYNLQIKSIEAAVKYPRFELPVSDELFALPEYLQIRDLSYLAIIQANNYEIHGNKDKALDLLENTLKYSNRIKNENNNYLISFIMGISIQDVIATRFHHLTSSDNITKKQLKRIQSIIGKVQNFDNTNFSKLLNGEFRYFKKYIIETSSSGNFSKRFEKYRNNEDFLYDNLQYSFNSTTGTQILRFLFVLFPDFYIHKNRSLLNSTQRYEYESTYLDGYCTAQSKPSSVMNTIEFEDIFIPNSLGLREIETPNQLADLNNTYLPNQPVDYFSGESLLYSKDSEILYSVGYNNNDDKGDLETTFFKNCFQEDCRNNPTFPIDAKLLAKEEFEFDSGSDDSCTEENEVE